MATILILDADELTLLCLQDVLEAFGHLVLPTSDPETMVATAKSITCDLLLVDIQLAGVQPGVLFQSLREANPKATMVAVTAYPRAPATQAALEAGATITMQKPFEIGQIIHLLSGRGS